MIYITLLVLVSQNLLFCTIIMVSHYSLEEHYDNQNRKC
jgi:hypothetical protein